MKSANPLAGISARIEGGCSLSLSVQTERDRARESMVTRQIASRGIKDNYVLEAMRSVPREAFLPENSASLAYADMSAPIGYGQTISQPYIVARMAQLADLHPTDKVLEIGTGTGYGAAVLASISDHVYTMESEEALAARAESTLQGLGYHNVTVLRGDGTGGWPDEAPYNAIIVTAAAPDIPDPLKAQLAVGGRLIIPAGPEKTHQTLYKIIRIGETEFVREEYEQVAFVPLVGKYGWHNKEKEPENPLPSGTPTPSGRKPAELLRRDAEPLPSPDSPHFARFFDRLAKADIILLGESTHGTAEFYRARALITQRLIRNHGFNIVALEADWPDMAILDGYVRNREVPNIGQASFSRFPEWMWRNREFRSLVHWMRKYNDRQTDNASKAGLYGLDLYSMKASIHAIIDYLDKKDPELSDIARTRYGCFEPWQDDPASYGQTVITADFMGCEREAVRMLMELMSEREIFSNGYADNYLDVTRNAELVVNAEKYYRVMYLGLTESWNLRDRHMYNTLRAIMKARGPRSKAVVWAHNSHIGDARATEMGTVRGEINLGQLCRENFGDRARLVGFGTGKGRTIAASHWGGPAEIMPLRDPLPGSYERLWVRSKMENALLDMTVPMDDALQMSLEMDSLQRAVGVVYRPESERMSHYFRARPARQFDYYVWFRETSPLTPLPPIPESGGAETYPFGL